MKEEEETRKKQQKEKKREVSVSASKAQTRSQNKGRRSSTAEEAGSCRPCAEPRCRGSGTAAWSPWPCTASRPRRATSWPSTRGTHSSYGDQVQHFKVLREASGKYYLWEEKFNSLNELVAFYRTTTIAKKRQVFLRDEEPLAKPPRACFAQAQFDFLAQDPSQLSFRRGDIIEVMERLDPCWWRGRLCGRVGFFPRSYVQPVHL
ncbi:GRB2-related adapter protein isoform X2 [Hippopotamus amphibius kiboko]|uniref:GRB2-related adapter protein isoform X2 n=1 Tax=Hippopotamus amphibius kiboko TaxID=575201 RepID=UPI0025956886|nr:GRB2-related adapter protein isoform X2 [Hippopotamus amphibius kiboko]